MPDRILTLRDLNRATLARQMLLERESLTAPAAIERLAGMQAQAASAPFVGLWTRLENFTRADLAAATADRTVVKATLMRATLHLFTAADYARFRTTLQPALDKAGAAIAQQRGETDLDVARLLALARAYLAEQPRTFAEISAHFSELMPDSDIGALRYTIRTHLPLVQVPTDTAWSYPGSPQFTLADAWLDQPIAPEPDLPALIRRYLAAFGPATIKDMETWSYLPDLKPAFELLRPELVTYRDEKKRELFDLPGAPLPAAETPAPPRFLPEFDNLLLSHDKRTRVLADAHRKRVYLPGLRVAATILIDGFVGGVWKVEKAKRAAALVIEPFAPLSTPDRAALEADGERLVRFIEPDAQTYAVRFAE